ncbi:MAG TPA: ABC-type transport auxiliary lipoprotein family protein [Pusillimonas sp.]
MRQSKLILCLALGAVLAGCAAPPTSRYYTLVPAATPVEASGHIQAAKKYAISVQPVQLPEQVDRPQIVISVRDSARITPLNESLWASPLSDEIRRALSADLSAQLGVLDIAAGAAPATLPVWKIYVTVQRFDSVFDSQAILDATWHLKAVHKAGKDSRICRAQISIPVDEGGPALVEGQRKAIRQLTNLIAAQLSDKPLRSASSPVVTLKGCV